MTRRERRDRQKGRRALDYRAMMSLDGNVLRVRPYASHAAVSSGTTATREEGASGSVTLYDVSCLSPLPTSATESLTDITIRMDLTQPSYPGTAPSVMVVSHAKPFCTHVQPGSGFICLGSLWEELKGKELAAELAIRLFRAFNFQDPPAREFGFQPDAYFFYTDVLKEQPFRPGLELPAVPDAVFHVPGANAPRPRASIVVAPGMGSACGARVTGPRRCRIVSRLRAAQ